MPRVPASNRLDAPRTRRRSPFCEPSYCFTCPRRRPPRCLAPQPPPSELPRYPAAADRLVHSCRAETDVPSGRPRAPAAACRRYTVVWSWLVVLACPPPLAALPSVPATARRFLYSCRTQCGYPAPQAPPSALPLDYPARASPFGVSIFVCYVTRLDLQTVLFTEAPPPMTYLV